MPAYSTAFLDLGRGRRPIVCVVASAISETASESLLLARRRLEESEPDRPLDPSAVSSPS